MPAPALTDLRGAVREMTLAAVKLLDADMDRHYAWGDYDEEGLRFALLMAVHELRDLAARVSGGIPPPSQAQRILAGFMEENAALAGLLFSASDEDLDRKPGPDDWCLREVVQHILRSESGFTGVCLRGIEQARRGEPPVPMRDADYATFGRPPQPLGGTAAVVGTVLASRDNTVGRLAGVADGEIDTPVYFWESEPLSLRFRLIRFELHLVQHAVQAEKTMTAIGYPPSESERLARRLWRLLGEVEGACLPGITPAVESWVAGSSGRVRDLTAALAGA